MSGLTRRQQLRFGVAFATAEGIMPLVGFLLGKVLAQAVGDVASYIAIGILFGLAIYVLREALFSREEERDYRADNWAALVAAALSVSMDELAVGFSLGLLSVPILVAVLYIALQAFVLTIVGTTVGKRLGYLFAERAELVSGLALMLLAFFLLAERVAKI